MEFLTALGGDSEEWEKSRWERVFEKAEEYDADMSEVVDVIRRLGYMREGKLKADVVLWAILYAHLNNVKYEILEILEEMKGELEDRFEVDKDEIWNYEGAEEMVDGLSDEITDEYDIWNYPSLKEAMRSENGGYSVMEELARFLVNEKIVIPGENLEIDGIPLKDLPEEVARDMAHEIFLKELEKEIGRDSDLSNDSLSL